MAVHALHPKWIARIRHDGHRIAVSAGKGVAGRLASEYDARTIECRSLLLDGRPADAIASCDAAVAAATQMPGNARLEQMVAYQRGGEAHLRSGRTAESAKYFESEVALGERGNGGASIDAWWNLARAYCAVPDLPKAKRAFDTTESRLRTQRDYIDPKFKNDVSRRLQSLLTDYVDWLTKSGQLKEALSAQRRLDEVTKSIR